MDRSLRWIFLAGLLLTFLAAPLSNATAQSFSAYDLIAAVNNLRQSRGLQPYEIDGGLMAYAQEHSEYQARTGVSTHTHSDGLSPSAYGVTENIATGSASFMTMDFVVNQVWADALHMNTMIGYESGYVGAGIATAGGDAYITLDVRPGKSAATLAPSGQGSGSTVPSGTQIALVPLVTATPGANGAIVHPVGYGQSLWSIAIAYGVKINDIRSLNGLAADSTDIYAGQKLLIRQAGAQQPPPGSATPESTPAEPPANPTLQPTFTQAATATALPTPSQTPTLEPKLLVKPPAFSGRRVLAIALILVGLVGVVWVVRSGFVTRRD